MSSFSNKKYDEKKKLADNKRYDYHIKLKWLNYCLIDQLYYEKRHIALNFDAIKNND